MSRGVMTLNPSLVSFIAIIPLAKVRLNYIDPRRP
jgi:hypothetical protein